MMNMNINIDKDQCKNHLSLIDFKLKAKSIRENLENLQIKRNSDLLKMHLLIFLQIHNSI